VRGINRATTFEEWKRLVEMVVQAKTGMSCDDLDDWRYVADFEEGVTPRQSAARAIRNAKEACGL
jgi:hypothetical protein